MLESFENDTKRSNGGERVTLSRPGDKEWQKERYYIRVVLVEYNDNNPWPPAADGTSANPQYALPTVTEPSLLYGNDP
ncbi:MAG: hypothetical protein JXA82_05515 [Sedimentisphaerales bacterium]|nr:hypothetical protein [Sedimentisphaerales bacterium]